MIDYEDTAAWKLHSDRSDKKRTKSLGEIKAVIDNDPSKSIRTITRDIAMSEFLIRQLVHEDIWNIKDEKGRILIGHE